MQNQAWRMRVTLERDAWSIWAIYLDLPKDLDYFYEKNKYQVHYGAKWLGIHKAKHLIRLEEKGFNVKK